MQTAAFPYRQWLQTTAAQAERTASQASAAAEAFTVARAGSVPPPVVAANRAQLLQLIATNLLGQNTPAIAATEAEYTAMWAQDAAAMNTYSVASQATVSGLPTFTPAAQTADPITLGGIFQQLIDSSLISLPIEIVALFTSFFGPFLGSSLIAGEMVAEHTSYIPQVIPPIVEGVRIPPVPTAPVAAARGVGGSVGKLSVPPSWAQPRPAESGKPPAVRVNPGPQRYQAAIPAVPFMPITTAGKSSQGRVREDPEYGPVSKVMPPRHPAGG